MTPITTKGLAEDIEAFLVFKRALGYQYRRAEFMLRSFERFVQQHSVYTEKVPLEAMVSGWLSRIDGRKSVTVALELGVLRQLCLYRRRHDPRGFVPSRAWAPQAVESMFLPYVFSRKEVQRILDAAEKHPGKNIGSTMLRTLLLVLYCTGVRVGEAVRLQLQDVDLKRETFTIYESKGKTRIVPFRSDLAQELKGYIAHRERIVDTPDNKALFVRLSGRPLPVYAASTAIRRLLRRLGLKPPAGRVGPRPYDLRHAFAVHRLTEWYHNGVDIHARLPWLSAYMGHDNVLGTEVYLTATPELMALASERFEQRLHNGRRQP